jgi:two-component system, LytTR family, response regulator
MSLLRCLIIDDEPLARSGLRRRLSAYPGLEVVGEAGSRDEALALIQALQPNLLTLDIDMPGGHGFEVLAALPVPPAVIFVTAYNQYAMRAFEVNAVDYLLKPIEPERLENALARVVARIQGEAAVAGLGHPLQKTDAVLVEFGHSGHFVSVDRILLLESAGNYCRVSVLGGQVYTVRQTLSDWVRRLPPELFVQLDRGLVINRTQLQQALFSTRSAQIALGDLPKLISVGMAAAERLRHLLARS